LSRVAIIADTTVQMTPEMAREHGIRLVPLHVIIDGKSWAENEVDLAWFYGEMPKWKESGHLPSTSSPSVGDFLAVYQELAREAEAVLYIALSPKFSNTFNSGLQATKRAETETPGVPFGIVNTLTACGGQMLVAVEASRAGVTKSLPEVTAMADSLVKKTNQITLSDDLYYLAKGGRIHEGRPWAGSRVANAVLLEADYITGGVNKPLGRYKTQRRAIEALFKVVRERSGGRRLHVAINHAGAPAEAQALKEQVQSHFNCAEIFVTPLLPLVTIHNGLGALKFSWWAED